jgi:mRNA interferase HigB
VILASQMHSPVIPAVAVARLHGAGICSELCVCGRSRIASARASASGTIIARRTLKDFVQERAGHRDARALKGALDAWFAEVRKASWPNMAAVKRLYATASIVSADRVVFNIKGNSYRLVVAIDFEKAIVFIKWIGTHADYDKIDIRTVQHGK